MVHAAEESNEGDLNHAHLPRYHHLREAPLGMTKQIIYGEHVDPEAVHGLSTKKEPYGVADIMKSSSCCASENYCCKPQSLDAVQVESKIPVTNQIPQKKVEVGADQLISPPQCVALGLDVEEYTKPRSKGELQEMLKLSGVCIAEDVFDTILQTASQANDTDYVSCTLAAFMQARKLYLSAEVQ